MRQDGKSETPGARGSSGSSSSSSRKSPKWSLPVPATETAVMSSRTRPESVGAYYPDMSRRISRLPAYMEIIRESERKKLLEEKPSMADKYFYWAKGWSRRVSRAVLKIIWDTSRKASHESDRAPRADQLVQEGKTLCHEYISHRLRRSGDLASRHLESLSHLSSSDASEELQLVGEELEAMYPDLFKDVHRQLNIAITTDEMLRRAYSTFAEQLCKDGIHWGKIVALFAMAGAFAEDCAEQGRHDFVLKIVDSFGAFVSARLADWLAQQGGWIIPDVTRRARGQEDKTWLWMLASMLSLLCFIATGIVYSAI